VIWQLWTQIGRNLVVVGAPCPTSALSTATMEAS